MSCTFKVRVVITIIFVCVNTCCTKLQLLEELCVMGRDPHYLCEKAASKTEQPSVSTSSTNANTSETMSSDSEDDYDDVASTHSATSSKLVDAAADQGANQ